MAEIVGNKVKLDSGRLITPQRGGWYDGQQYWDGTLSQPGQINQRSDQIGAGQAVSQEVIAQTSPANVDFINQRRQQLNLSPSPTVSRPAPTPSPQPAPQESSFQPTFEDSTSGDVSASLPDPQPAIDLPALYESQFADSGISEIEADLSAKGSAYAEQVAKIKDNPYLSEADMTGRIKKLTEKFEADQAVIRNDIAVRKADIETKLNLELKQFDINSDQAKLALDQFNSLLEAGALDRASGEDIANLTRSTGIKSSMIQSAIQSRLDAISAERKEEKEIKTSLQTIDDGTTQWAVLINTQTGDVISRTELGRSKPKVFAPKEPKAPKPQSASEQKASVAVTVQHYIRDKKAQKSISPEALYRKLIREFPGAFDYIEKNWTGKKIRAARK
jgi:hypothetical protein|tara:strand:+ start:2906 stop:4075 length:1170 start_codon:yes stop_codon:yes gene_type:complete